MVVRTYAGALCTVRKVQTLYVIDKETKYHDSQSFYGPCCNQTLLYPGSTSLTACTPFSMVVLQPPVLSRKGLQIIRA
jgi:hypothetical protein